MDDAVAFTCGLLEKQAVKQWEVFHKDSHSFRVEFKDGVMDTLQKARVSGLAVRVIRESRIGFSFTSALDASSLQKTVDTALSIAGVMPLDPDATLAVPAPLPILQEKNAPCCCWLLHSQPMPFRLGFKRLCAKPQHKSGA